MKKLFLVFAAVCLTAAVTAAEPTKKLRILMIGNSFSVCVGPNLHQIVKKAPKCKIQLVSAYIGGCTFQKHWQCIEKAEKDPKSKSYSVRTWDSDLNKVPARRDSVNNLLKQQWDIITIQQGSHQSWDFKFYEPYAGNLIKYIRKHAPKAEIVIQQTWSYRVDDGRLKRWKLSQTQMYDKVNEAYRALAKKYNLRIIPMGHAVQIARKAGKVQSTPPTPAQDLKKLKYPALPSFNNDVVGYSSWRKDKKTKAWKLGTDPFHLSARGRYLQACVWFCSLYGKTANDIKYKPRNIKAQDAENLRKYAQQAVKEYKQIKK